MDAIVIIVILVLIFKGLGSIGRGNGTGSPVGYYDGKWKPIKCPKCGCKYVSSTPGYYSDDNWECDDCGHRW